MNTDIRIAVSFRNHRKRRKLRLVLGDNSTDYLIDLWLSTAMNHPDGKLTGMDEVDIALEAGWEKDPAVFVDGLIRCGFLDRGENGTYHLHDWEDHQMYAIHADARTAKAKKAANARWGKPENATSIENDAKSIAQSIENPCPYPSPSPSPSPKPETDMVVVVGDCRASAREEPPPPPPPKVSAAGPTEAETGFRVITETWNAICGPLGIERLSDPGDWSKERRDRAWWLWGKAAKRNPGKVREVCEYVVSCPRLIGKAPPGKGYAAPWVVDFDWLMRPENFQRFREGHFAPRGEAHA